MQQEKNLTPKSTTPTFDDLVRIIEKNFKAGLFQSRAFTEYEVNEEWIKFKTLNHLYQDETKHPGTSIWVKAEIKPKELLKPYYCKLKSNIDGHIFKKIVLITLDGQWQSAWDVIEWLDENESPSKEGIVAYEWISNALQWAKEAIDFASDKMQCPEPWVETWGNAYMNAMHAIQEAQREIDPNSEAVKARQEAFLEGQSKERNKEQETGQSNKDDAVDWIDVNDRLPYKDGDSSVYCLVNDTYDGVVVRPFNEAHVCWDQEDGDDYYTDAKGGKITHWRPLPDPPKKKQR